MKIKTINNSTILLAAVLFAGLVLVTSINKPQLAQAAFPGANGKIVFHSDRDGNSEIYTMNADGTGQTNVSNDPALEAFPSWSPDGKKIAFISNRDGGDFDIFVMDANGSNQVQLTANDTYELRPVWSPDGKKIAFKDNRDVGAGFEIYVMSIDGTGQTNISNNVAYDAHPDWSPDGNNIAFVSSRDGNNEIYTMNPDGSNTIRLTNSTGNDLRPSWSADGTRLAFQSDRDGNSEIYTMNPDGSILTRITANTTTDDRANWSPDGSRITYSSAQDGNNEIYTMNSDGSNKIRLTTNVASDGEPYWQPQIGTTTTNPNGSTTTTIAANESYPVLDYTVSANETLTLNGQLCDVTVQSGGTLMGTGTACTITVEPGGTVNPGNSPGCLMSGNLSLSGTYIAELAGTTSCTGYDQLQVTGTVTVGGALQVSLLSGFVPTAGNTFTLITNDSTDPVTGTFNNLAEGATVTVGTTNFTISYIGGTGNDVVLTAQAGAAPLPGVPSTGSPSIPDSKWTAVPFVLGLGLISIGLYKSIAFYNHKKRIRLLP